jgi:hypothetical protein
LKTLLKIVNIREYLRMFNKILGITLVLCGIGCSSTQVGFQKGKSFNPDTKKVVTMAVFDMSSSTTGSSDDESNKTFGTIAQAEVGNIYGSLIPGGEITIKAAEGLGIKAELDKAIGKLTEAIVNSNSVDPKTTEVFAKIAVKLGVEALAFPLVSGTKDAMAKDPGLTYRFAVYDVRSSGIQYIAQIDSVTVNNMVYDQADANQKKAMISAAATKAVNSLFAKVKEELAKEKK